MAKAEKITIGDIEGSLRSLSGGLDRAKAATESAQTPLIAGVGALAVIVIFLLGYRRGRRKSVVLEVKKL